MKISILTLFPKMFSGPFDESIIKRAIEKNIVQVNLVDIRDFGLGSHKTVDDTPYGGGVGMLMRVDVVKKAIDQTREKNFSKKDEKVLLLSAAGTKFNQRTAMSLSKLKHLIIICGHYEGVDYRIRKFIDLEISIGDFVLTGGEIPAMAITDVVLRLVPGVLKKDATNIESFSTKNLLEYPQFTKPAEFEGQKVPEILLSGDHGKINEWRSRQAHLQTRRNRPDLIKEE